MYRLHLASSYGFYSHLILKFQTEFGQYVKIDGFLDFPIINYEKQPVNSKKKFYLKVYYLHKNLFFHFTRYKYRKYWVFKRNFN